MIEIFFVPVTYDILKKVKTLDTLEASQQSNIPTKILKQNSDYFAEYFLENINQCRKSNIPIGFEISCCNPSL